MSTWIAAVVDTGGRTDFWDVARRRDVLPIVEAVPPRVLIECEGDFDASTRLAELLSAELQVSAVALVMQTTSDVYGVRAFDRGALVRRLDYSRDFDRWVDVVGERQPWEPAFFFDGPADLAPGARWPDTIYDDISDDDIARYEAARNVGDASGVMDLVHASGGSIHRVAAVLGVDPSQPAGRYRRPSWWRRALGR